MVARATAGTSGNPSQLLHESVGGIGAQALQRARRRQVGELIAGWNCCDVHLVGEDYRGPAETVTGHMRRWWALLRSFAGLLRYYLDISVCELSPEYVFADLSGRVTRDFFEHNISLRDLVPGEVDTER